MLLKKVENKAVFLKKKEKEKRNKEEKKLVVLDSSSEEDSFTESESKSEKTPPAKRTRQKIVPTDSETTSEFESSPTDSESTKKKKKLKKQGQRKENNHRRVSTAKRRRETLQLLTEKRRNDGAQKINVAPDRFDSTEEKYRQNSGKSFWKKENPSKTEFTNSSSTTPDPELQIIEVREETRLNLWILSLPSSLKEELIKDAFIYVPSESITQEASVNDSPLESQQQPCKEAPAGQSEQEAPVDVCPPKPEKQAGEKSSPTRTEPEPLLNVRRRQLEILADAVIDAGVAVALKCADAISAEPSFTAAEGYKTPEKEKEITEEMKEKCLCWETMARITLIQRPTRPAGWMSINMPTTTVFLNKRKLASHPFLFVPICNGGHWWLWIADVQKKAFYVLDPVNKKKDEIPDLRIKLHIFVGLSHMRVYAGVEPLMEDGKGEEVEYIRLNVNVQEEIDSFRLKYGPNILLHKLDKIRDQVIRASEAIRLPKPSSTLSSPYCKFTSRDIYSK
ncbi:hypothetical protein Ahy_B04g072980 [Arachis hypogaea]|uniref:Ubiquitin-like protease family profile domain-containing protein n=1 Tax=Arachis hypogaea TaxID=3818 RepID=A0A444ZPD5_ARAHY|nr:hypothetical protein Ahy_B04g072980 [Arachis hypogaea]